MLHGIHAFQVGQENPFSPSPFDDHPVKEGVKFEKVFDRGRFIEDIHRNEAFCSLAGLKGRESWVFRGGGPGVGPIAVAAHLAPYLPGHPLAAGRVGGKKAAESWALPPRNRWNDIAAHAPVGADQMALLALLGTRAFAVNRCLTSDDPMVRAAALFNPTVDDAVRQSVAGRDRDASVKNAAVRSQRLQNRFGGF